MAKRGKIEDRIKFIDALYQKAVAEKLDLNDAISLLNNLIRKNEIRKMRKRKVANGYLPDLQNAPGSINILFQRINVGIVDKDAPTINKSIVESIDVTYKTIITKIDKSLESKIPFIDTYLNDLFTIFGKFLGCRNEIITKELVRKYFNNDSTIASFEDLDSLLELISSLLTKVEKHPRLAKNNFCDDYFAQPEKQQQDPANEK